MWKMPCNAYRNWDVRQKLFSVTTSRTDGTAEEVLRVQSLYPDKDIRLERGPGVAKSRNVWTGFGAAAGDILMILDADLTTIPEELPYFVDVIASGQAEFVNGSRLVYPVPRER